MKPNVIKCKNCGTEIEISEALTHQIEEQVLASLKASHKTELEEVKKLAEIEAVKKASEELSVLKKDKEEELERNKKLMSQIGELLDEIKALRRKDEEREIEMKKKMMEEEEKIVAEVRKKSEEEHQLKDLEKDKKIADALKQVEELKVKMQQGSQQGQGEVLELELERILKTEFPSDNILEVKKGERGADVVHEVVNRLGKPCGVILWESKNAQWSDGWILKLKEDQRAKKSELAVLVIVNKPEWLKTFTYKDGIWVTTLEFAVPLAFALRFNLVSVTHERQSSEGKDEKMKVLYTYLTGPEFKHRIEGIVEAFGSLQEELEKEKRWFGIKWARQEKEIRKIIDQTHGMYGDFQGVIGRSLPEIRTMLPEPEESE